MESFISKTASVYSDMILDSLRSKKCLKSVLKCFSN